jgi:hypothetical protein
VHGDPVLSAVTLRNRETGEERTVQTNWLFVCIGGMPHTEWAEEVGIARDEAGYLVTGRDLSRKGERPENWPLNRDPYYLETNVPGVFAVLDQRPARGPGWSGRSASACRAAPVSRLAWPLFGRWRGRRPARSRSAPLGCCSPPSALTAARNRLARSSARRIRSSASRFASSSSAWRSACRASLSFRRFALGLAGPLRLPGLLDRAHPDRAVGAVRPWAGRGRSGRMALGGFVVRQCRQAVNALTRLAHLRVGGAPCSDRRIPMLLVDGKARASTREALLDLAGSGHSRRPQAQRLCITIVICTNGHDTSRSFAFDLTVQFEEARREPA